MPLVAACRPAPHGSAAHVVPAHLRWSRGPGRHSRRVLASGRADTGRGLPDSGSVHPPALRTPATAAGACGHCGSGHVGQMAAAPSTAAALSDQNWTAMCGTRQHACLTATVAWCSVSISSAPEGSDLLTSDGSSIWTDPGPKRGLDPGGATRRAATPLAEYWRALHGSRSQPCSAPLPRLARPTTTAPRLAGEPAASRTPSTTQCRWPESRCYGWPKITTRSSGRTAGCTCTSALAVTTCHEARSGSSVRLPTAATSLSTRTTCRPGHWLAISASKATRWWATWCSSSWAPTAGYPWQASPRRHPRRRRRARLLQLGGLSPQTELAPCPARSRRRGAGPG
jgi:hypothetical protein